VSAPEIDLSAEACEKRLYDCLVAITEHPERWEQGDWARTDVDGVPGNGWPCGTVACLAGTAVIREGLYKIIGRRIFVSDVGIALCSAELYDSYGAWRRVGALLLGLSSQEARHFFQGSQRLSDLWGLAYTFTDGRVRLPDNLLANVRKIDDDSFL